MSIFGHDSVRIRKQPEQLRWLILTDEGKELIAVPWYTVYDTQHIKMKVGAKEKWDKDRREALDAAMSAAPLTDADRAAFFAAYPAFAGRRPYTPRNLWDSWAEPVSVPEQSRNRNPPLDTPPAPVRQQEGDVDEEPVLSRKLLI